MQYNYAGTAVDLRPRIKPRARSARRLRGAMRRALRQMAPRRSLSLALQGGGSFGAFTWGVLDRLLEKDRIAFDTISGASAGAINAVLLASGLAEGGPRAAREKLDRFWRRMSQTSMLGPFGSFGASVAETAARAGFSLTQFVSPYQFNPLGLNPLRDILAEEVNFAQLRAASPTHLLIAATRVRDGSLRLFRTHELTLDVVMASACLPQLHHSVEIDGEWYWDGGFSANPPLRQLALDSTTQDLLLVQIMPEVVDQALPRFSRGIARRMKEMSINFPLQKEIEALDELCAFCKQQGGLLRPRFCRKLERLRLHRLVAERELPNLRHASAMNLEWSFLNRLKSAGGAAAERWLADLRRGPSQPSRES
jgi:NTE family protein